MIFGYEKKSRVFSFFLLKYMEVPYKTLMSEYRFIHFFFIHLFESDHLGPYTLYSKNKNTNTQKQIKYAINGKIWK